MFLAFSGWIHPLEVLLHLQGDGAVGGEAHRAAPEDPGYPGLLDLVAQGLLQEVQHGLALLGLLFQGGLLLVGLGEGVVVVHRLEGHVVHRAQGVHHELVGLVGEVEDLVPLVPDALGLGQLGQLGRILAAGVVDILLLLGHAGLVLGQGGELEEKNSSRSFSRSLWTP